MPKTLLEKIVFTIIMAAIMVYGMIVYNVALNTGGVTNATFAMALHEMPIMVPAAFILEFFVVEKLATRLAFRFMRPTDRPKFITYAISLMIVCIMCPVMSLIATVLFKEPSFGTWVHTFGCELPHGAVLADVLLRPAEPCHFPPAVPPGRKAVNGHIKSVLQLYKGSITAAFGGCIAASSTYINLIYRIYKW